MQSFFWRHIFILLLCIGLPITACGAVAVAVVDAWWQRRSRDDEVEMQVEGKSDEESKKTGDFPASKEEMERLKEDVDEAMT